MFQVKIGMRNIVMPGARMATTVATMFTAGEDARQAGEHDRHEPQVAAQAGRATSDDSGVYPVQPKSAAPSAVRNPVSIVRPPNR